MTHEVDRFLLLSERTAVALKFDLCVHPVLRHHVLVVPERGVFVEECFVLVSVPGVHEVSDSFLLGGVILGLPSALAENLAHHCL